ncbi:hypothetical protein RXV91_05275 [Lactiplantibacillus sp. DA1]|nr:hypothetical protein [Lactiplantibacillus sp. DA1]
MFYTKLVSQYLGKIIGNLTLADKSVKMGMYLFMSMKLLVQ